MTPCVRITNHKQAADLAKGVRSCTRTPIDGQRRQRRVEGMVCGPCSTCEAIGLSQDVEPPRTKSSLRHGTNSMRPKKACANWSRSLTVGRHTGCGFHRSGLFQPTHPHERSPYVPHFMDRSHEEIRKQERCCRMVSNWRCVCKFVEA